jgi:hypothetical protein
MEDFIPLAYTGVEFPCSLMQTLILLGQLKERILHAMGFILQEEIERDAERKKGRKKEGKKGRTNLCIRRKTNS